MEFIETSIFTKQIVELLDEESYRSLQEHLVINPNIGDLIKNSGGLRKVRWQRAGKGKRGGIRVIYYYKTANNKIFLLLGYRKNKQENLTTDQLKILREILKELK